MADLLSIDWDFFTYNGVYDWHEGTLRKTGSKERIHGAFLYDWGHSEKWGPKTQEAVWQSRGVAFHQLGMELEQEASVAKAGVEPGDFVEALTERFDMEHANVFLANSHAWGTTATWHDYTVNDTVPPTIWNFDAHHDLGYSEQVFEYKERGANDCADWAWHVLDQGIVDGYHVVYPDWQGYREIRDEKLPREAHPEFAYEWWNGIDDDVHFTTWSEWKEQHKGKVGVSTILIVRSSSWTPPWEDGKFRHLVRLLEDATGTEADCWDCEPPGGTPISGYDACALREWDHEGHRRYVEEDYAARMELLDRMESEAK